MATLFNRRFLDSTRGKLVVALRRGPRTTGELAQSLSVTENAVRAHLASLERDGLVRQTGIRHGRRKPHFEFALTAEAEQLFPKAHSALLNVVLGTLAERMPPESLEEFFSDVARRLAEAFTPPAEANPERRVEFALAVLAELGGLAEAERHNGGFLIRGFSCPLGAIVRENPQACRLAEKLIAALTGLPVRECCQKGETPRCQFEVGMHT